MESNSLNIPTDSQLQTSVELQRDTDEGELSLDIFETDETIFLVAPVAGIDEKSIDIALTEDLLTIRGSRPRPLSLPKKPKYYVEECYWGSFYRSVLLPAAVNSAEITARLERDIIIIEIPKARKVSSKSIPLSSSL